MGFFDKLKKSSNKKSDPRPEKEEKKHPPKLVECWEKQGKLAQNMQDASEDRTVCKKAGDAKGALECEKKVEKYKSLLHDEQVKENKLRE